MFSTFCLWAASFLSAVTWCIHTLVGGARVARPLLVDTSLPPESKWLNYYCWHIATLVIAFLVIGFGWLAIHANSASTLYLTALSGLLSFLSAGVAFKANIPVWKFPSTSLFAVIGVLGALSLISGS